MRRNALAAAFCCGLIAAGATSAGAQSAQSCLTAAQCSPQQACINHTCVSVCLSSSQCSPGQVCEDGTCVAPACGSNSDCGVGQICSGGACVAAPTASSVASCNVTPGTAPGEARGRGAVQAPAPGAAGRPPALAGLRLDRGRRRPPPDGDPVV